MKPGTIQAMKNLIIQIREAIPFDTPTSKLCAGPCRGCPKKLLEFLDCELEYWEERLEYGDTPTLGDINTLAKRSKKIYYSLDKNGIIHNT